MDSQEQLDNLRHLIDALDNGLDSRANRLMDSGTQPNLYCFNSALESGLYATADRIMTEFEVQPDLRSLHITLFMGLEVTSNHIMNLGVQPDLRCLNNALSGGLDETANRIMNEFGLQPDMHSLNSALHGGLFEIAETVILPSLSRRNIQPYEHIDRVKDFMDHQRSKGNINSLENYLSNMTNPVNDKLKSESLRSVIENHFSPLKNKKKPRPSIR